MRFIGLTPYLSYPLEKALLFIQAKKVFSLSDNLPYLQNVQLNISPNIRVSIWRGENGKRNFNEE
jgi:hypothetical protein